MLHYLIHNVQFQQKNYKTYKLTRKCGLYTRKKQSVDIISAEAWVLDLLDQNLKSTISNMFKKTEETISKELKKCIRRMTLHVENISKVADIKICSKSSYLQRISINRSNMFSESPSRLSDALFYNSL